MRTTATLNAMSSGLYPIRKWSRRCSGPASHIGKPRSLPGTSGPLPAVAQTTIAATTNTISPRATRPARSLVRARVRGRRTRNGEMPKPVVSVPSPAGPGLATGPAESTTDPSAGVGSCRMAADEDTARYSMNTRVRAVVIRLRTPAGIGLLALAALAAALRFSRLGHQGFWFDEGYSALLVHQRPSEMLHLLRHSESTPPLYYCVAWVWVRVFGFGEAGLRSLSALAGTATVPLLYLAGTRFASRRAGLAAAALAATNPLLIWYSQEARSYALLAMFSAATLAALPAALGRPGRRPLAIWAVLCALALATHYYAVLVVVPQAVLLLWRRRRAALPAVAAVAVVGLGLLPWRSSSSATTSSRGSITSRSTPVSRRSCRRSRSGSPDRPTTRSRVESRCSGRSVSHGWPSGRAGPRERETTPAAAQHGVHSCWPAG